MCHFHDANQGNALTLESATILGSGVSVGLLQLPDKGVELKACALATKLISEHDCRK